MKRNDWIGQIPKFCDICGQTITGEFIDGKTSFGSWALMCNKCHETFGYGLGEGKGQKFSTILGKYLEG